MFYIAFAVGGQCEILRQCIAKSIVTVRRADPEAKAIFHNFTVQVTDEGERD